MVPRRRARKILKNSQLIFFIFKTLSQTFLQNILRDFQFFGKIEYWRYYTQKCTHMQEAVVKKKDTMTESTENIKKQSTHIFHFQNFVTDIFAKHFERFQFFGKIEYWRYYTQKCTHMQEAVVKKKDTMTESTENTKI